MAAILAEEIIPFVEEFVIPPYFYDIFPVLPVYIFSGSGRGKPFTMLDNVYKENLIIPNICNESISYYSEFIPTYISNSTEQYTTLEKYPKIKQRLNLKKLLGINKRKYITKQKNKIYRKNRRYKHKAKYIKQPR